MDIRPWISPWILGRFPAGFQILKKKITLIKDSKICRIPAAEVSGRFPEFPEISG
jgi:hypothetical protein